MKKIPDIIKAGLTFNYKINLDFNAKDKIFTLYFNGAGKIALVGQLLQDNIILFTETSQRSEKWPEGNYLYSIEITDKKNNTLYELESGETKIIKTIAVSNEKIEPRSHVKIVLDAIEAVIEGRATKDQQGYTINNRSLQLTPLNDLLNLRVKYKNEFMQEQQAKKNKSNIKYYRVKF